MQITYQQLRILARAESGEAEPNLAHLLLAWATRDPGDELSALLDGTGLDTTSIRVPLQDAITACLEPDRSLLLDCLRAARRRPTGRDLLRYLCDAPEYVLTRHLVEAGLVLDRLRERLTEPPPSVLAEHGIRVDTEGGAIKEFARDLTELAEDGQFDGLSDRPVEIARIAKILMRMEKRNCALTGDAGTGKTALVELLARRIVRGEVPEPLRGLRIYEVRLGELVAGTQYRGTFEERVKGLIEALEKSPRAVLFVDELHLLWGAGRAEGAPMDASNMFKPVLARGKLRVIGATTTEEYNRYIAQDDALSRRFEEVRLQAPKSELVFQMVRARAKALAEHHGVKISDDVIRRAIELTERHQPARSQPDKTRDLLDDTCVSVGLRGDGQVSEHDLLETLSESTGLPIAELTGEDRTRLRELPAALKQRIIGQDAAVDCVANIVMKQRQNLGPEQRNLGAFLFGGSTGVGKTELARQLAAALFHDEKKALLHLDMAEYNLPSAVTKLVGASAGYIGHEKDGALIRWLHTRGSGVILFDEIEKAHPEVRTLLLGLLDEGRIHSAKGRAYDTRQCIVILTTNALTPDDLGETRMGFGREAIKPDPIPILSRHFPQEFLARLDEIVIFNALGPDELRQIATLRINEAVARLERNGVHLVYEPARLIDHLLEGQGGAESGARGIAGAVEKKVVQPIATAKVYWDGDGAVEVELDEAFFSEGRVTLRQVEPESPQTGDGDES